MDKASHARISAERKKQAMLKLKVEKTICSVSHAAPIMNFSSQVRCVAITQLKLKSKIGNNIQFVGVILRVSCEV